MTTLLPMIAAGYRLFLEPLPIDRYWVLLAIPLAASIAIVWKTIRLDDLRHLPGQAVLMTTQIIFFLIVAAAVLWLLTAIS